MVSRELPLTFRVSREESMLAVLTHWGTRKEEGTMVMMDERVRKKGRLLQMAQSDEDGERKMV